MVRAHFGMLIGLIRASYALKFHTSTYQIDFLEFVIFGRRVLGISNGLALLLVRIFKLPLTIHLFGCIKVPRIVWNQSFSRVYLVSTGYN